MKKSILAILTIFMGWNTFTSSALAETNQNDEFYWTSIEKLCQSVSFGEHSSCNRKNGSIAILEEINRSYFLYGKISDRNQIVYDAQKICNSKSVSNCKLESNSLDTVGIFEVLFQLAKATPKTQNL